MQFWSAFRGAVLLAALFSPLVPVSAATSPASVDTSPIECEHCAEWNQPHAPFRLYGNSYYVGVDGLSAILIDTGEGLVLLDGALPQSAPLIAANIGKLGFRVEDVRWIGISHAHFDHAGGVAALVRMSGGKVTVLATARAAQALRSGDAPADDPQAGHGDEMKFPPVRGASRVMADGETLKAGSISLRLIATPGHTPGGSSWTWQSCEDQRCLWMVYADSLTPVSASGFHFGPAQSPRVAQFRASIARIGALPCDVLVSAHPGFSRLFERVRENKLVDRGACRAYAEEATRRLDQRLIEEQSTQAAH